MTAAFSVLGYLHWGGLALIVLGYVMSFTAGAVHPVMVWGARIQLLLGLALVGVAGAGHFSLNYTWVAVKLLVALGVVACCEIGGARRRRGEPSIVLAHAAAALTLVNVLVATIWH